MKYNIKKLSAKDISLAKELIILWKTEDGIENPQPPNDLYINTLLAKNSFHIYVALINKAVVGGLTAYELPMFPEEETEMFLYEIGVHQDHRKQGIAAKLIEALKKTWRERNIKIAFVGTTTNNKPAKQLYKSTGANQEKVAWFIYDLGEGK